MTVFGIGSGLFVIFFFGLVAAAMCCFGAKTRAASLCYFFGFLLILIVILVIVLAPKSGQSYTSTEFDTTFPTRIGLLFIASFTVALGIIGLIVFVMVPNVTASRVYPEDLSLSSSSTSLSHSSSSSKSTNIIRF